MTDCRVLHIDEKTAGEYAIVRAELKRAGKPIPANDAWIAAVARQCKMAIVSRERHFDFVPQQRSLW